MTAPNRGIAGRNTAHLAGMHNVTQSLLAAYIGRSVQGVWNVVHGRSEPTHATAAAIAEAFGVTVDTLYADTGSCVRAAAGVSGAVLLLPVQVSVLGVPSPAVTPTNLL